ncbi:hypothetical protein [Acidipropionibacterium acidipropionici]|uniref:hypothetical protein n=1 Tax=Acidipropionibacterium acidipropionici TaxID=1748 RepID=UPI00040025BD|nr:hypothetical protein [Acidipropionibacterium acidipropionici]ALN14464.1 hypothetical protein ASQ49_03325 [Acidipropionibacterium acidipropionici]APZ09780.1 hypothetical protein BWX38_11610 [Acidipropionibacterium acidipropionici]
MTQEHPFPVEANDTPATQLLHDALPQRWRGLFTAPIVNRFLTWTDAEARVQAAAQKAGAQIITVGESRQHRPLHLYRFGEATRRTFWYAGPHANEPVGVSTVVSLAEALASHPEYFDAAGFDLMVCVDPDSHVANEHWFPGYAGGLRSYYENLYRPARSEFCDWDMPFELDAGDRTFRRESQLPEGDALRKALDISRPQIVMSLHNAEVGGMYIHQIGGTKTLAGALSTIPGAFSIPTEPAPIDAPGEQPIAPGVFPLPSIPDMYGPLFDLTSDDPLNILVMGESAMTWSLRYGAVSLVTEVPLWSPIDALPEPGQTLADVTTGSADRLRGIAYWLTAFCEQNAALLPSSDARARSVRDSIGILAGLSAMLTALAGSPDGPNPATEEDVRRWCLMLSLSVPLRSLGMLLGALRVNSAPDGVISEAQERFDTFEALLEGYHYRFHGVDVVSGIQIAAGVAAIENLEAEQ